MENQIPNRRTDFLPFVIFLSAFGFALLGLNPSFFLDDSPETITASLTLGIPHPPGYPLYTLLGYFFSALPLGHWTFRINLLSAVLASLVCVGLYLFLRYHFKVSSSLSALFSLFWIVGATAYPAALSAKTGIYHLTALFLIALLWATLSGRWALGAFLLGLSMTNHWMSMVAFLPGLAWLAFVSWKQAGKKPHRIGLLALFCVGLSPYLFLPLRAHLNPLLNWGDPSTSSNFIFNFFREQYGGAEGSGGPTAWFPQWEACLKAVFWEFSGWFSLLAVLGVWKMAIRARTWAWGMGAAWLSFVAIMGLYLNLPKDQYFLIPAYVLPAHVFILLFAAVGTEAFLFESAERKPWEKKAAMVVLVLLLAGLGLNRFLGQRQSHYTYSYDYVLNGFKTLPRNSLYFCKGDGVVFPGWYFQWIEGKRPDVALIGVDGLPMAWVRRNTALFHRDLKVPFSANRLGNESIPTLARWVVDHNGERQLYFSYNQFGDGLLPVQDPMPYGLTVRGFLPGQQAIFDESLADYCWKAMRLRNMNEGGLPLDSRTRDQVVRNYAVFRNTLGLFYEDRGDAAHEKLNAHSKAGELLEVQADYEKSLEHFKWAGEWDPEDPLFAFNTANALVHVGQAPAALGWYEKAIQLDKNYLRAYFNWAVAAYQAGQYQKAGELFQKVLDLKPDYPEAQRGLETLKKGGLYSPSK